MTVKFFAKMLIPEAALIIKKDGQTLEGVLAEKVEKSKYANAEIADWTMNINGPACTIEIK